MASSSPAGAEVDLDTEQLIEELGAIHREAMSLSPVGQPQQPPPPQQQQRLSSPASPSARTAARNRGGCKACWKKCLYGAGVDGTGIARATKLVEEVVARKRNKAPKEEEASATRVESVWIRPDAGVGLGRDGQWREVWPIKVAEGVFRALETEDFCAAPGGHLITVYRWRDIVEFLEQPPSKDEVRASGAEVRDGVEYSLTHSRIADRTELQHEVVKKLQRRHADGPAMLSGRQRFAMETEAALSKFVINREEAASEMEDRSVLKADRTAGIIYVMFLLLYCMTVFEQADTKNRFELESLMKKYMEEAETGRVDGAAKRGRRGTAGHGGAGSNSLGEVSDLEAVWEWLETAFVPATFPDEEWYNGDPWTENEQGFLQSYNKLVGGFQLVQRRIDVDADCESGSFDNWSMFCWPEYGSATASTAPFGPAHDPNKYTWSDDEEGGGYHVRVPLDRKYAFRKLSELREDKFLDKQTREISIDFTVFNEAKKLFCSVRVQLEQEDTGNIETDIIMATIKMELVSKGRQLVGEILCIVYMVFSFLGEFGELHAEGLFGYFSNVWNVLDWLRIFFFFYSVTIYSLMALDETVTDLQLPLPSGKVFVDFEHMANLQRVYDRMSAITIIFCTHVLRVAFILDCKELSTLCFRIQWRRRYSIR